MDQSNLKYAWSRVLEILPYLYGDHASDVAAQISDLVDSREKLSSSRSTPSHKDAMLICYGDHVKQNDQMPLETLRDFLQDYGAQLSSVHILPFFPFSSDDGFSVIDYNRVRQDLGTWSHIKQISDSKDLMIDAVLNHVSAQSHWFEEYLKGNPEFRSIPISVDPNTDLSDVVRPRTSPLLTSFDTAFGRQWIWTTFSADQVDLNYADPKTLLRVLDVLLTYAENGAKYIRIDAATYMWKEIGTSCASLPNTHRLVQLFRAVLDIVSPATIIITETNVPHEENISYFGDGSNEAQFVYNFALPPLVFHAIARGTSNHLQQWASRLRSPEGTAFFNFLASHDGIGLRGAEGILPQSELEFLADRVRKHGGYVSMRTTPDGGETPYELNISYFDALSDPHSSEAMELQVKKFLCAYSIALTLAGLPGIYFHSLVGSRSAQDLVQETGSFRSINRELLDFEVLKSELDQAGTLRNMVYSGMNELLSNRANFDAFDPFAPQAVIETPPELFGLRRFGEHSTVIAVHNLTGNDVEFPTGLAEELEDYTPVSLTRKTGLDPWEIGWYTKPAASSGIK